MVASTDIKFYVHTNNNAPQLTNNFGCMIDVLDACLVNGFGAQSVSTLKAVGKVVTVTFGAAHNLMQYQVIKITGANQSEFNGEHRILSVPNANSFTFELANTATVTQASGTIVCSLPPLGWEKPFGSTHSSGTGGKAAYRSTNLLLASRPFLRVVDELDPAYTETYAKYAKVGIVEDMTDINTMLGVQAPYDAANPDKNWVGTGSGATVINGWAKWYYAANSAPTSTSSATAGVAAGNRDWVIVGNKDWFYIFNSTVTSNKNLLAYGFGAFESALNPDNASNFLSCTYSNTGASSSIFISDTISLTKGGQTSLLLQRKYDMSAVFNIAKTSTVALGNFIEANTGSSNTVSNYMGNTPFAPIFIFETGSVFRGVVPNFYWLFQNKPLSHLTAFIKLSQIYLPIDVASYTSAGQIVIGLGGL